MSKEQNAAALTKFAEAVNTGNYNLFDEVVAADSVDHDPGPALSWMRKCLLTDVEWDVLKLWLRKHGKESGRCFRVSDARASQAFAVTV